MESFDPGVDIWRAVASMSEPQGERAVVAHTSYLYAEQMEGSRTATSWPGSSPTVTVGAAMLWTPSGDAIANLDTQADTNGISS